MARPIRQFLERHVVEAVRALEPGECRHRYEVSARWRCVGKVLALVDVENRVLAHHRDETRGDVVTVTKNSPPTVKSHSVHEDELK
jgi:hypothetical protein